MMAKIIVMVEKIVIVLSVVDLLLQKWFCWCTDLSKIPWYFEMGVNWILDACF